MHQRYIIITHVGQHEHLLAGSACAEKDTRPYNASLQILLTAVMTMADLKTCNVSGVPQRCALGGFCVQFYLP